jgi:hypothetical protein
VGPGKEACRGPERLLLLLLLLLRLALRLAARCCLRHRAGSVNSPCDRQRHRAAHVRKSITTGCCNISLHKAAAQSSIVHQWVAQALCKLQQRLRRHCLRRHCASQCCTTFRIHAITSWHSMQFTADGTSLKKGFPAAGCLASTLREIRRWLNQPCSCASLHSAPGCIVQRISSPVSVAHLP